MMVMVVAMIKIIICKYTIKHIINKATLNPSRALVPGAEPAHQADEAKSADCWELKAPLMQWEL